jgi:branched-chain amino acid transport system ATP-binding protein
MNLLDIKNLSAHYGDFQALFGVSMHVAPGETVALVGANGAGKTTLLRTIAGLGTRHADRLAFKDADVSAQPAEKLAALGIAMVPEGRRLFAGMSVMENLMIGADLGRTGPWSMERVFDLFPELAEFSARPAGLLSGGQQQMVSLGRALMINPELLLVDEVSLGLAPVIVDRVYDALARLKDTETTIVLVEQDIRRALQASDRFYCMLSGRITLEGPSTDDSFDAVSRAYFGEAA